MLTLSTGGSSNFSRSKTKKSTARQRLAVACLEVLEDRRLLSATSDTVHLAPPVPAGTVYTVATQPKTLVSEVADAAPTSHTQGVPQLSSRPGAPFTIYLDFAGFDFVGNWHADGGDTTHEPGFTPALDDVSATGTFNANQQASINAIWARVAESYSELNVNVTTVDPAVAAGQAATDSAREAFYDATPNMMHTVIGSGARGANGDNWLPGADGVSPGIGIVDGTQTQTNHEGDHTNFMMSQAEASNGSVITAAEADYIGGIASHENAHSFGLYHQGDYTGTPGNYTQVAEYSTGDDGSAAGSFVPIIGDANNKQRIAWRDGIADVGGVYQEENDLQVMLATDTAAMATSEGRPDGADLHFIADGIGETIATATALPLSGSTVNSALADGVIIPKSESAPVAIGAANYTTDYFSFDSNGSTAISLSVDDGSDHFTTGVADDSGTLESTLNIYKSDGTLVGAATEDASTEVDTFTGTLAAGEYYAAVGSLGGHQQVNAASYVPAYYFDTGDFFMTGSGFGSTAANAAPVVDANPTNQTVAAGSTVTFTADATATPAATVQWQVSTDGGSTFNNIAGATSTTLSFTTALGQSGNKYQAVFTNGIGSPAKTTAATLTVAPAVVSGPTITQNPSNVTATAGDTATFTAAATGTPTLTVQWQVSTDGGTTFNNVAGATSTTLSFTTALAQSGNEYRAMFSNGTVTAPTSAATLTVNPLVTAAPTITRNPISVTVTDGGTATFSAAATGSPTPTVQWQVSTDGGVTFTNVANTTSTPNPVADATNVTLSVAATLDETGNEYRAVFTNGVEPDATTTAATLTVTPAVAAGGSLAGSAATASSSYNLTSLGTIDWAHWGTNQNASAFDDKATGGGQISNVTRVGAGSYGAYTDSSRDVIWSDGTPLAKDNGDQSYIWANNATGAGYSFTTPADTTTRTLYVYLGGYDSGGTLTAHLSDTSAADYTTSFSGSGIYSDIVAITYKAGSASQHLLITYTKTAGVGVSGGSVDLDAAWLGQPLTNLSPVIGLNPKTQTVTAGTDVTFTASATTIATTPPTVQWYVSTDGGKTFLGYAGGITDTIDIGPATLADNGNEYEAIFTTSAGTATTSAATLTVNPAPSGSLVGSSSTAAASYNYTQRGMTDWIHWGRASNVNNVDRKATGGSQISNVTRVGGGSYGAYADPSRDSIWTDGTPTAKDTGDTAYIWANNAAGAGYSFTAPAGTATRTLYIYLGGYDSGGTLTATLSDNSAAPYTVSFSGASHYTELVAITYKAGSAGQTLTLNYTKTANVGVLSGSVDLIGAWLA
jgi:hypothetical protein